MGEISFRLGSAVKDGVLRFVSVSQIESFDPAAYGGCNRRWWFRRVARAQEAQGRPAALGEQVHLQLEDYLRNGNVTVLGPIARPGLHLLPAPGADLKLEWSFGAATEAGEVTSPLSLAGVPLIGKVDVAHCRGEYVDPTGELVKEPGAVEVLDHKTTKRIWDKDGRAGLAKSADHLASTWQMRAYAALATLEWPRAESVRLSHVYYQSEWPYVADKRTKLVDAAGAMARFKEAEPLVEGMKRVAQLKVVTDAEPNAAACGAFGGCPHRDRCPRPVSALLAGLFMRGGENKVERVEEKKMSLLQRRKEEKLKAEATKAPDDALVEDEMKKLVDEEKALVTPPDVPAASDVAQVDESRAAEVVPGHCGASGASVRLKPDEVDEKVVVCRDCGARLKARPKKLGDGFSYSLVPNHAPGESQKSSAVVKKREAKKDMEPATKVLADKVGAVFVGDAAVDLYIDSIEDGVAFTRLEQYAQAVADELGQREGAVDIRCAPDKSALSFGKWRGAFEAACRAAPPSPGAYLVASSAELGRVAFEALATMGLGRVVRGAK